MSDEMGDTPVHDEQLRREQSIEPEIRKFTSLTAFADAIVEHPGKEVYMDIDTIYGDYDYGRYYYPVFSPTDNGNLQISYHADGISFIYEEANPQPWDEATVAAASEWHHLHWEMEHRLLDFDSRRRQDRALHRALDWDERLRPVGDIMRHIGLRRLAPSSLAVSAWVSRRFIMRAGRIRNEYAEIDRARAARNYPIWVTAGARADLLYTMLLERARARWSDFPDSGIIPFFGYGHNYNGHFGDDYYLREARAAHSDMEPWPLPEERE